MKPAPDLPTLTKRLHEALEAPDPTDPLNELSEPIRHTLATNPEATAKVAYAELYAAPFHTVPTKWRRLYEDARLRSTLELLQAADPPTALSLDEQDAVITHLDMALIMTGAPHRRAAINMVLDHLAEPDSTLPRVLDPRTPRDEEPPLKRPRTAPEAPYLHHIPTAFPPSHSPLPLIQHGVPRLAAPSLARFATLLRAAQPVILTDAMGHWPALQRWPNPRYWLHRTHAGRRRVPVEYGRSYTDQGWGQGIVSFGSFLREELLGYEHGVVVGIEVDGSDDDEEDDDDKGSESGPRPRRTGYLAQHDLVTQIPALRRDMAVPDYCYCRPSKSDSSDSSSKSDDDDDDDNDASPPPTPTPILNTWLGPANTISPAHTDPHDNLLAQAVGRKYLRLYAPDVGRACLYPLGEAHHLAAAPGDDTKTYSMANTAGVDVALEVAYAGAPDAVTMSARQVQREKFPNLADAAYVECVLEAGEMLLIPRGWWHFVTSLDVSASVSFWW